MSIGLTIPFTQATGSLGLLAATQSELDAAHHNIKSLLLTNWGERPMHFHLGCNLIEFIFEQRTGDLRARIEERIVDQVAKWLPYVRLNGLEVMFPEDDRRVPENGVGISMKFALTSSPTNVDSLFVTS